MQASSPGGDSSYSWLFVCALDHFVGKGEWDHVTPPVGGVESERKYTRLHTWTLYCILHRWYSNDSCLEELESNSHGYSALPLSEL